MTAGNFRRNPEGGIVIRGWVLCENKAEISLFRYTAATVPSNAGRVQFDALRARKFSDYNTQ